MFRSFMMTRHMDKIEGCAEIVVSAEVKVFVTLQNKPRITLTLERPLMSF